MLKMISKKKNSFDRVRVYALIGRSGTGKSFRAQYVSSNNRIKLIIDDGLLIKNDRILAGKSAKQELNFVTAVKRALFQDSDHLTETLKALKNERFKRILILGTSEKMVSKIASTLGFPPIFKVIRIEDIATKEEIETAMRVRYTEGKHVIPVPPLQITRSYHSIVYDSIKVGLKRGFPFFYRNKYDYSEKTLVKPEFTKLEENKISSAAIKQMIDQCLYEYENSVKIENISYTNDKDGYEIHTVLRMPTSKTRQQTAELEEYIGESLERYGGLLIKKVSIEIEVWS